MDLPKHWDAESVAEAVDLLSDLVLYTLVPERWERVSEVLRRVGTALDTGDLDELRDATADLEIYGPERILRIGSTDKVGIPPRVLERRNELVHRLTGEPTPASVSRTEPEVGRDDQRAR
ncbi:hypothetical protein BJY16_008604 [Actinoplanes octamycinicus]|uniref:CATRA-Associated Small Protein domain-containing protein n=1 Tax=Actinoplanes octamycinicus TaxID=135948 RepID=A0A7W7H6X7_9ACTN|nr:CATRA system-associated protein [Actinoplanes octamycinicus]MBB4745145.1 hypothetical protein [Actinoplanes octamycinicus]GIE62728.1 hypothetical protein Aoc01nite_81300 [Actinoplanes octamycinicus]